jgi:hypothetical protein
VVQSNYSVTFVESGLASGTSWYVNMTIGNQKVSMVSTTADVVFSVPDDNTYQYTVDSPIAAGISYSGFSTNQYVASPSVGTVTVSGSSPAPIRITYTEQYLILMSAAPTGDGLVFPGITYEDTGANIVITAVPTSPNVEFSGWTGVCFLPTAPFICTGSYTGSNNPADVTVNGVTLEAATFVNKTFNATFTETGLPANCLWNVTLNGTTSGSTTPEIQFAEPSGTYPYSIQSPVNHGAASRYVTGKTSGTTTINLAPSTVNISFYPEYLLSVGVASSGGGTVTPASGWLDSGSLVTLSATPSPGYTFIGWQGEGNGSYTGAESSTQLRVVGPITETASFGKIYNVIFTENGLPANKSWSMTLGSIRANATTSNISFPAIDGSYNFSVGLVPGFIPSVHEGSIAVDGASTTMVVNFTASLYLLIFAESGLPSGTNWSVTVDGTTNSSGLTMIVFVESNGSYSYSIPAVSGYHMETSTGTAVVDGNSTEIEIKYTAIVPTPQVLGVNGNLGFLFLGLVLAVPMVIAVIVIAFIGLPGIGAPPEVSKDAKSSPKEESEEESKPAKKHRGPKVSEDATEEAEMDA